VRKAAIILILTGLAVLLAANIYLREIPTEIAPVVRDNTTLRAISSGEVVGFRGRHGARTWLGLRYAAAPSGNDRWRAPQPPETHDSTFAALQSGPPCPQFASQLTGADDDVPAGAVAGDEDCLFLNVWSPPNATNLPVMLWVHGGGNSAGHGGSYNGAMLAASHDVVVVSINYRLGVFGWFSHPALATGDVLDDSGNYGTLDLIRALQWVQENIQEFGGNSDNVTVFGESAGGWNALAMMVSPLAAGLVHKVVVQSGGLDIQPMANAQNFANNGGHRNSSNEILAKLLVADGIVNSIDRARSHIQSMSRPQIRQYLYSKTTSDFFNQLQDFGFGMADVPTLFGDNHVLPDLPIETIFTDANRHNMVPVILGSNRDEAALFMVQDPRHVENWLGFLPRLKDPQTYQRLVKYRSMAWKATGVDQLAQYMTRAGNNQVFAYRFDWDESPSRGGFDLSVALGAAHGLEIPFVFNEFDDGLGTSFIYPGDDAQFALARSMSSYWAQFAHTSDPGSGRDGQQVTWLPWLESQHTSIVLDTTSGGGIRMMSEVVDMAKVITELAADPGFSEPAHQCMAYVQSVSAERFDTQEYEQLNSQCAGLDPDTLSAF